ncbi:hypothetical protein Q75_06075 [Bacillus coahuilensis p1.1.43]|uniref:Type III secretion exporter n=2 Tax=Bacillus coahuilensis TaxID=408580 RepID=A0A147K9I0_9BACI|nr:EscU/YscU/HrcU family type III secretion system export apparatus switch protein [Bacillus coahuilensis]KUP07095.1 hypothetical protein Q75_06075 [Bacillus coahuilensis p1.1.43]
MEKFNRKSAIALRYDDMSMDAPKLIAKGKGLVAEQIIEKAKENGIQVQEDPNLVEMLSQLNMNETIPAELYEVVAEVFAYVYKVDQKVKHSK